MNGKPEGLIFFALLFTDFCVLSFAFVSSCIVGLPLQGHRAVPTSSCLRYLRSTEEPIRKHAKGKASKVEEGSFRERA